MSKFFVGNTREYKGVQVSALMTTLHYNPLREYTFDNQVNWRWAIRHGIRVFVFTDEPQDFHVGWTRSRKALLRSGMARYWKLDENLFVPGTNGPKMGEHEAELFKTTDIDIEDAFAYCGESWDDDPEDGLRGFINSLRPHRYALLSEPEQIGFYSDEGTQEAAFVANGKIVGRGRSGGVNWPFYQVDGVSEVLRADDLPYYGIAGTGPYFPLGKMIPIDQRKSLVQLFPRDTKEA